MTGGKFIMKLNKDIVIEIISLMDEYYCHYPTNKNITVEPFRDYSPKQTSDILNNPRRLKVKQIINNLSPQERSELLALFSLGRGDGRITANNWDALVRHGENMANDPDISDYLVSRPSLADYFRKGLEKLGMLELVEN